MGKSGGEHGIRDMEELRPGVGAKGHMQAIADFLRRHGGTVLEVLNILYRALRRTRGRP